MFMIFPSLESRISLTFPGFPPPWEPGNSYSASHYLINSAVENTAGVWPLCSHGYPGVRCCWRGEAVLRLQALEPLYLQAPPTNTHTYITLHSTTEVSVVLFLLSTMKETKWHHILWHAEFGNWCFRHIYTWPHEISNHAFFYASILSKGVNCVKSK